MKTLNKVSFYILLMTLLPVTSFADEPLARESLTAIHELKETDAHEIIKARPGTKVEPAAQDNSADPNYLSDLKPIPLENLTLDKGLLALPDRWRIVETIGVNERWFDPYNQNTLKADRPIYKDIFFNINILADLLNESRSLPTPVAPQSSRNPGALDVFGGRNQNLINTNLLVGMVLYQGNTTFKPPDYELRVTTVFNYNHAAVAENRILYIDSQKGNNRGDQQIGMQELFVDKHLRNVSDRYDFDSIRVGIQPMNIDFRGFLFQDDQFGVRLFGNRHNNLWQYNLAWFKRIEKDTNSGLNDISQALRDDQLLVFNLYRQDFPVVGFILQGSITYNQNSEDKSLYFDKNGFLQPPGPLGQARFNNYQVTYFGLSGDGHFNQLNTTTSLYYVKGREALGTYSGQRSKISAYFGALEASMDFDYIRVRLSALYASGDHDPFDNKSTGFDAIFENPIFAGADTSFWIRQPVPNIGGGAVSLSNRNGVLNAMRTSKEHGQSNFTNPGTTLLGLGIDVDLMPELRVSLNFNQLGFVDTSTLEVARQLGDIHESIGLDASVAVIYRPWMTQNVVLRLSAAGLFPGNGFKDLYGNEKIYSLLANLILRY